MCWLFILVSIMIYDSCFLRDVAAIFFARRNACLRPIVFSIVVFDLNFVQTFSRRM
jgi:hypothetical protein